ncbi:MAG: nucleotidyltransferase domain-containing protein [Candidatus Hodarchaeales archaeon]
MVKLLPRGRGIIKGDSLLTPDSRQVELAEVSGRIEAIVRDHHRFIPVSTGPRSWIKGSYAILSLQGLTSGALRLKLKNRLSQLASFCESNPNNNERKFILSILRGESADHPQNLNWTRLTEIAYQQGVLGILFPYLKGMEIPESTLSSLEGRYHAISAANLIRIKELEKLEDALSHEKVKILTLKGASLIDTIYPSVGMRPMDDIDLMVRPKEWDRFAEIMHRLGYRKDPPASHSFKKDGVTIDLHTHALNIDRIKGRSALFPYGMAPVWAESLPWKPGFRYLRSPDNADQVILLTQHLMKHSFSKLIWLVDIYRLMNNQGDQFWKRLTERSDLFMQRRSLSYVLYLLKGLFGYEPPRGSGIECLPGTLSRIERAILDMTIKGQSLDGIGPLMALFCIPKVKDKIRFGFETMFPKEEIVTREFGYSSSWKRIFFIPVRLFQMAAIFTRHFALIICTLMSGSR